MKLHEAIKKVLIQKNKPLKASDIAEYINSLKIYTRGDGNPVPSSQIHARVNQYPDLFIKNESGFIDLLNRRESEVKTLLENMILDYRNSSAHGRSGSLDYLLIPLCFFFKRAIDNPHIIPTNSPITLETSNNKSSFTKFIRYLNGINNDLQHATLRLLNELENGTVDHINSLLESLDSVNLNEDDYSVNEFSEFYLNLIRSVSEKNYSLGLYSTPDSLAILMAGIANLESFDLLYNPATGIGTLPVFINKFSKSKIQKFAGEEINHESYLLAYTNLLINHIDTSRFYIADSLSGRTSFEFKNILVVCNPPFQSKFENRIIGRFPSTGLSHLLFLEHVLMNLKKSARAILLMPEGFLFSQGTLETNLKKHIIDNNLLEGIISLPPGILAPYSSVKTSLVILNSKKKSKVSYLIDAEHSSLHNKTGNLSIKLYNEKILNLIKGFIEGLHKTELVSVVEEPITQYNSEFMAIKNLTEGYNITVKKLIAGEVHSINYESDLKKIEDFAEIVSQKRESEKSKYVNISDLNSNFFEVYLKLERLQTEQKPGTYIDFEAILIGTVSGSYKPTYFDGSVPVIASPNIYVLRIKDKYKNTILPEYLVYKMAEREFVTSLESIAYGSTSLRRITKKDLLALSLKIPGIKEQLRFLRLEKDRIIQNRLREVSELESNLGLKGKTAFQYMDFIEHELGNIAGGAQNQVKVIEGFIKNKGIDLSEKVSGAKNSSSLSEVLHSVSKNLNEIKDLTSNIRKIVDISKTKLELREIDFKEFITNEVSKLGEVISDFSIFIGIDDNYSNPVNRKIEIDNVLFSLVIRNFIKNSIRHGYTGSETTKNLIFNLTEDDDFFYLNMINDGKSFPENFSTYNFIEFGKRGGPSQGSGLGGYIMNEIIEKHNGELYILDSSELIHIGEGPNKIIVKTGVHIQVKLPKEF
jgi:type I restriction enzyme M protein